MSENTTTTEAPDDDGTPETKRQTIAQWARAYRVTMSEPERVAENPNMTDFDGDHWRCVLRCGSRRMTVYFSQGYGHNGKPPKLPGILSCLASDAATIENSGGFEDWARDLGFDADSRKAEANYRQCERQTEKLKRFLSGTRSDDDSTTAYAALLWNTEGE